MSVIFLEDEPIADELQQSFTPGKVTFVGESKSPSLLGVPERKTWRDAFSDVVDKPTSFLPYLNALDLVDSGRIFKAARAVERGDATTEQSEMLNNFLADRQREQSFGYKAWSVALRAPAYALEFLTAGGFIKGAAKGTVMGGLKAGGTKAAKDQIAKFALKGTLENLGGKAALRLGAKATEGSVGFRLASFLAEDVADDLTKVGASWLSAKKAGNLSVEAVAELQKNTIGLAGRQLAQGAVSSVPRTLLQPHRVANSLVQNMTPMYALTEDEQGLLQRVLIQEGDDFLPAFAKAFGDIAIENFSEQTAESFVVLKGLFGPAANKFFKASFLAQAAEKVGAKTGKGKAGAIKDFLRDHFLGAEGKRGLIEKAGWHGVLGELGEEAVGGVLRQAVGISPIGIPDLEDVASMAVGFALNPLAIGGAAYDGFLDVYTDKVKNVTESIAEAKAAGPDFMKDAGKASKLRDTLRDYMQYFKDEQEAELEGKLNVFDKMMRFMVWDNMHRRVGQRIGEEIGPALSEAEKERFGFDKVIFSQYILEATARNIEVIDNKTIDNMIEAMMGVRFIDPSIAEAVRQQALNPDQAGLQYQEGLLTGARRSGNVLAPVLYVEQGNISEEEYNSLLKSVPWLVSTQKYDAPTASAIEIVDRENPMLDPVQKDKKGNYIVPDSDVYQMASFVGISQVKSNVVSTGQKGLGIIDVRTMDQLRNLTSQKIKKINAIASKLPQGRRIAIAPSIGILDQRQNFTGQPIPASIQDFNEAGEVLLNVGAHWNPNSNTITISASSRDSDIDEDTIESIAMPPEQTKIDEYVSNFAEAIRNANDASKEELADVNDIEIFSKVVKTVLFGHEPEGERDLASFIKKLEIDVDKVIPGGIKGISGYLNWKANQQGASDGLFKELGIKNSIYDAEATYEHDGFTPSFPKAELFTHFDNYKRKTKDKVDSNFSLVLDYTPKLHEVRYAATTKAYMTKVYQENAGKLDDMAFGEAMIDKHGRKIIPYLKKFFDDLYSGEIKLSQQERKVKRESKAVPAKKIQDEAQEVPSVGSVSAPVVKSKPGAVNEDVPEVGTVGGQEENVVPEESEPVQDDEVPNVGEVEVAPGSPAAEDIEFEQAVQAEKDADAEARALAEEIKASMPDNQRQFIEKIEAKSGKNMVSIMEDRIDKINSYSLRPEDMSDEQRDKAEVLSGIKSVEDLFESYFSGEETPTGTDKNPISEDKTYNDAYKKIREITNLIDDALDSEDHIGSEAYYRLAKNQALEKGWADAIEAVNRFIPERYKDSLDKFFNSIEKVPYKYIETKKAKFKNVDNKTDTHVVLKKVHGSFGKNNGVDIESAWHFTDISGKKRPALLMHSFGLKYLKDSKRRFFILDGIKMSEPGKAAGVVAGSMTTTDRRNMQKMLFASSVSTSQPTFDLLFSRFGSKGITPIVEMPRYEGAALEAQKKKYTNRYKKLSDRAKKFILNPEKMTTDFDWNVNIARETLFTEMFGSYDIFFDKNEEYLDLYNMMKRTEQVFTPGVSSDTEVKYVVFDDAGEFDGMAFFGDEFKDAYFKDVGRVFINPDMANFIKGFMIYKNANGNMVSIKPLLYNTNVLQGKPYYDEIKSKLDELNAASDVPVLLIPSSSVKVWGKAGEVEIAGKFENGKLTLDTDFESKMQTINPGDMTVINDAYNFSLEEDAKTLLRQVEGLNLLYENEDLLQAQKIYNDIFNNITRRIAENINFEDIVANSPDVSQDDIDKFSDLQRAMRLQLSTEKIITGPDAIKAIDILSSAMAKTVSPIVSRSLKITTAPGGKFDSKRTLRWDEKFGLMPAVAEAGKMQDETSLVAFDSEAELIASREWYAHVFEMDRDGSISNRIREKLVIREKGKILVPRDIKILTRIPASSVSFATISAMMNKSSDAIASFIITDHETNKAKGEDFDADFTFADGLFRYKDNAKNRQLGMAGKIILSGKSAEAKIRAASNRAFLHTVQGYLNASSSIYAASKRGPDKTTFDEIISPRKQGVTIPALTSEKGQTWWDNLVRESGKSLGIAASQSTVSRYLDYVGVHGKVNEVISKKHGLAWNRNAGVVNSLTQDQKLERDYFFNNVLVNMYVDDMKDPKVYFLGHDRYTTGLLYGLILGNPQLTSESDIKDFMRRTTEYFESDLIKQYIRYKSAKAAKTIQSQKFETSLEKFLIKQGKELGLDYDESDVAGLLFLNDLNNTMIGVKQYIDVLINQSINNPSKYEKLKAIDTSIEKNSDKYLDWSGVMESERGAVFSRVSGIIDMNYQKIFSNDISLSVLADRLISSATKKSKKVRIPERKELKNILLLFAAINAVDKGRGLKKPDLIKKISAHQKAHKKNDFVKNIKYLPVQDRMGLDDKLFKNAKALTAATIEKLRNGFDQLPVDVQDDYVHYQLMFNGLTFTTFSGQFMRVIGDDAMNRLYEDMHTETQSWLEDSKSPEEFEHMLEWFVQKLKPTSFGPDGKPYVPYYRGYVVTVEDMPTKEDLVPEDEAKAIEYTQEAADTDVPKVGEVAMEDIAPEENQSDVIDEEPPPVGEVDGASRNQDTFSFSLTWDNAVSTEAFRVSQNRYYDPIEQRIFAKRYNNKWAGIVKQIESNKDRAEEIANAYNLPEALRSKVNTLLYRDEHEAAIRDAQTVEQQQQFSFSLVHISNQIDSMPQFYTAGAEALHSSWMKIRNKMQSEVIKGRLYSDRIKRLARGLKGLGYYYEENAQGNFNVYDMDKPRPDGTYPILPTGLNVPKETAVKMQKDRDRQLRKEKSKTLLTDVQVAEVLSAATSRHEKVNDVKYLYVTSTGPSKEEAKGELRDMQPAIDLVGEKTFNTIVEQIDLAMKGREAIVKEMEELAGPEWISERKKTDLTGANVLNYLPHFYRKETDENGNPISGAREDTNRSQARVFNTYIQAFQSPRQFIPITTDASELVRMWYEDVWGAAVNRTMITLGATMRDVDAAPLWIPTFNEEYVADKDTDAYRTAMSDDQMRTAYEQLKDHLTVLALRRNTNVFIPEEHPSSAVMMNRLVSNNVSLLKADGYVQHSNSKFKSINNWWVRKGEASENLLKMLDPRPIEWRFFGGRNWSIGISKFNNWSKNISLSLSLFHPVALMESLIAIGGLTVKNFKAIGHLPSTIQDIKNMHKKAMSDPDVAGKWINKGLRLDPSNPNYDNNQIFEDADYLEAQFNDMGLGYLANLTKGWKGYNKWMNKWLWSDFLPAIKLWAAEHVHSEMKANYEERGISYDNDQLMTDISQLTNDAFGGQNWDQYIWATPERMRLLHLMMFAPDWTLSAFNISGAPNLPILRNFIHQSPVQKEWQLKRYWPGMAVLVMAALPQAVQLAFYSIAKILPGPDDEEAKPFLWQNESGKEGYGGLGASIDVTPLLKKLGYKGEPTGKRRIYIRWAKQANEVFEGWATKPLHTLMAKTSPAVKTVLEQMTGTNTAGWTLGFKDKDLMNGLFSGQKGFTDSRISYVGQKFLPMSILSFLQGRPSTVFAPASKGMSNYVAQTKMAQILTAYADDDVWNKVSKNKQYETNLTALAPELLDAAERNGLDPDAILTAAKRHTLATLYNRFFQQLNKSDYSELEKTANSILRVNGTIEGLERSIKIRAKNINKQLSSDDLTRARQAFE